MESLRQKGIGNPRRISMTLAAPQHPPDRDQTQLWGRIYSVLPVTCCVESELGLNKWVIPHSESSYSNQEHQLTRPRQTRIVTQIWERCRATKPQCGWKGFFSKGSAGYNVRGTAKTDTSYQPFNLSHIGPMLVGKAFDIFHGSRDGWSRRWLSSAGLWRSRLTLSKWNMAWLYRVIYLLMSNCQ